MYSFQSAVRIPWYFPPDLSTSVTGLLWQSSIYKSQAKHCLVLASTWDRQKDINHNCLSNPRRLNDWSWLLSFALTRLNNCCAFMTLEQNDYSGALIFGHSEWNHLVHKADVGPSTATVLKKNMFKSSARTVGANALEPLTSLLARFMGPTWGPSGADRTQVGPMLAPWILPSGLVICNHSYGQISYFHWHLKGYLIWWEGIDLVLINVIHNYI